MLNEQIRVPKISRAQLVALLVLTRLFILLIFVPTTHESPGGTTSLVSILFGYLLTVPVLIPVFLLLRDYPGMDLYQVARQLSPRLGKLAAAGVRRSIREQAPSGWFSFSAERFSIWSFWGWKR